jgi:hypothetical protein
MSSFIMTSRKTRHKQPTSQAKRRRQEKDMRRGHGGDAKHGTVDANLSPDQPKPLEGPAADYYDDHGQEQHAPSVPWVVSDMSKFLPAVLGAEPESSHDGSQDQDAVLDWHFFLNLPDSPPVVEVPEPEPSDDDNEEDDSGWIPRITLGESDLTKTLETTILHECPDAQPCPQDDDVKIADGNGNDDIPWPYRYTASTSFEKSGQPSPKAKPSHTQAPMGPGQLDTTAQHHNPPRQSSSCDDTSKEECSPGSSPDTPQQDYALEKGVSFLDLLNSPTLIFDEPPDQPQPPTLRRSQSRVSLKGILKGTPPRQFGPWHFAG